MRLFGYDLRLTRRPPATPITGRGGGGWWPLIREPYAGAWQRNDEQSADSVLAYSAVFACITLIASDIAKLGLRLVQVDDQGIWSPVTTANPFTPVLRRPNRFQNRITFIQQWLTSKLIHGNTYVLKQRDQRGIVVALYVLDPTRVVPLVSPDGSVFYELRRDDLSGIADTVAVPAREIIHDLMVPLFHPLIGVTPLFACGLAAWQGLHIQGNSAKFFSNGSQPGGVLTAPGAIGDDTAARLKEYWDSNFSGDNVGKVAVLGDGLKYEPLAVTPADAQLIEQLEWTGNAVCTCYHVPPYMIDIGDPPNFNNVEALNQRYYSQCLQALIESAELCLDEGLELPKPYGTEFDVDDLLRMDTATKTKAAADGVGSGCLSPDEARRRYFGLGPTPGGAAPYMQQQYYSLAALAARDAGAPGALTPPPAVPPTPALAAGEDDTVDAAKLYWAVTQKAMAEGLFNAA